MSKRALGAAAAAGLAFCAAALHAKRTPPPALVRYLPGDSWTLEDTLRAQIPDPQTGDALTPTTRGLFRYRVERELSDRSVVLVAKVVSLKAGSSEKKLDPIPVDHPDKPEQYMLASADGEIFGPYPDGPQRRALQGASDLEGFFGSQGRPAPWITYKVPAKSLRVGGKATREVGGETWTVRRLDDAVVGGVNCGVYEAELEGALKVVETTWFDHERGRPVRRKIVERRAKNVSSTLTQVRL